MGYFDSHSLAVHSRTFPRRSARLNDTAVCLRWAPLVLLVLVAVAGEARAQPATRPTKVGSWQEPLAVGDRVRASVEFTQEQHFEARRGDRSIRRDETLVFQAEYTEELVEDREARRHVRRVYDRVSAHGDEGGKTKWSYSSTGPIELSIRTMPDGDRQVTGLSGDILPEVLHKALVGVRDRAVAFERGLEVWNRPDGALPEWVACVDANLPYDTIEPGSYAGVLSRRHLDERSDISTLVTDFETNLRRYQPLVEHLEAGSAIRFKRRTFRQSPDATRLDEERTTRVDAKGRFLRDREVTVTAWSTSEQRLVSTVVGKEGR